MDAAEKTSDVVSRLPLRALALKPGMAMQTRRIVEGATKKESQYFGAIEGKGVMVGPLGAEGAKTELEEGEVCVVRGFTGQYEYSFLTKVLQTFEKPFAYALLAYPAQVDARLVRHSMRILASWPARLAGLGNAPLPAQEVLLVDLSSSGAMVKTDVQLAHIGDKVQLSLSVLVDKVPTELCLVASVCHNNHATGENTYVMGMAFQGLTVQDKLVLSYLTHTS